MKQQQYPEHDIIRPAVVGQDHHHHHHQPSQYVPSHHHQQAPQPQFYYQNNGHITGNGNGYPLQGLPSQQHPIIDNHNLNHRGGIHLLNGFYDQAETSEYIELQESRKIIEVLHHRVRNLENINMDLERRLEQQAKALNHAEQLYTEIDRSWKNKFAQFEKDTNDWEKKYEQQVMKTEKLREHLSRTERELYGILQRKYQLMRGGPQGAQPQTEQNTDTSADPNNVQSLKQILSLGDGNQVKSTSTPLAAHVPSEEMADLYKKLPPEMRSKRLLMDMSDFLGL